MSAMRLRSLCIALFVLDASYTLAALLVPGLPGWKMFDAALPLDVVVVDRNRVRVDLRKVLPTSAQLLDGRMLDQVVTYVCRQDPAAAPYVILDRKTESTRRFTAPRCQPDAPR